MTPTIMTLSITTLSLTTAATSTTAVMHWLKTNTEYIRYQVVGIVVRGDFMPAAHTSSNPLIK
jgi:hypothetical protein